jgi:hypothetical protein
MKMFKRNAKKNKQIEEELLRTKTSQFLLTPLTVYRSYPVSFFLLGANRPGVSWIDSIPSNEIIQEEKPK